jgi:hypothetical protein
VVENQTPTPIKRVDFYFAKRTFTVDNIAPGASVQREVTLRGTGNLKYSVVPQTGAYPLGVAADYLDSDDRGCRIGLRLRNNTVEKFYPK